MRIADGLEMLEIEMTLAGRSMMIHPVILREGGTWVLIDTGMPGQAGEITAYAEKAGMSGEQPIAIILTHQDIDHIGGLPGFMEKPGGERIGVYAHQSDREVIDGEAPLLKLSPERLKAELDSLPAEVRFSFEKRFANPVKPNVTHLVTDGEVLPFGGGLTVIHTPGHTPGHISLYHQASRTLIAGDALVVHNGKLAGSSPYSTIDMEQAVRSLEKFKPYPIEAVVCYHGGLLRGDINRRIADLI